MEIEGSLSSFSVLEKEFSILVEPSFLTTSNNGKCLNDAAELLISVALFDHLSNILLLYEVSLSFIDFCILRLSFILSLT
jgi:hypothetical protein